MAAAYLDAVYGDGCPELDVACRHGQRWEAVIRLARGGVNAPRTSSAGRLFDAVAAIAGLRDSVTYEGQAAVELEQRANPWSHDAYPVPYGSGLLGLTEPLIRAVVDDVRHHVPTERVATRFHNGLATAVVEAARAAAEPAGLSTVALSGGVFQNMLLLERVVAGLSAHGLRVLVHHRVPPNDGGLCLGQAAVAAARDA